MNTNRLVWLSYAALTFFTICGGVAVAEHVCHFTRTTAIAAVLIGVVASIAGDVAVLEKKARDRQ